MSQKPKLKQQGHSDIFQTPDWPIDILSTYIGDHKKIWECASGKGNIKKRLEHHGHDVVGTDIMGGFDFLSPLLPPPDYDCIVTNPPYSIKDKWLERCYDLGKPFALLMPITALGEGKRFKIYQHHGIELLMLPKRVDFETPSGKQGGAWFYCAWFCHGLNLPQQITFPH